MGIIFALTTAEAAVEEVYKEWNRHLILSAIYRIVIFLKLLGGVKAVKLRADVLEANVMNICRISVCDIAYRVAGAKNVTVYERYVFVFRACGFNAKLAGLSPIAPQNAVFNVYVLAGGVAVFLNSFNYDSIVKGVNEGIFYNNILRVDRIDAVGVVSPLTEYPDTVDDDVRAMEKIQAPDG